MCLSEAGSMLHTYLKWWSWFFPLSAECCCCTWRHKPPVWARFHWSQGPEHLHGSPVNYIEKPIEIEKMEAEKNNLLNGSNVNSTVSVTILCTYHSPFFAIQLQHRRLIAGWGGGRSWPGGWERFGSWLQGACLRPQVRILVGLLVIRHMLQPWMCVIDTDV